MPAGYRDELVRFLAVIDGDSAWIDWWRRSGLPRLGIFSYFLAWGAQGQEKFTIRKKKEILEVVAHSAFTGMSLEGEDLSEAVIADFSSIIGAVRQRFDVGEVPGLDLGRVTVLLDGDQREAGDPPH